MYENYQLALIVTFATLDILLKPIMLNFICFIDIRNIIDHMCTNVHYVFWYSHENVNMYMYLFDLNYIFDLV